MVNCWIHEITILLCNVPQVFTFYHKNHAQYLFSNFWAQYIVYNKYILVPKICFALFLAVWYQPQYFWIHTTMNDKTLFIAYKIDKNG